MRLSLSKSQSRAPIVVTLVIVAFLVVYYLLVYIPNNEQEIKNQRFRVLQRIDKNIHDKIDNSVSLLDVLLKANGGAVNTDSLKSYIDGYSKDNFILDKIQREPDAILSKYKKGDRSIDSSGSITGTDEDPVGRIKVDDLKEQFEIIVRRIIRENGKDHIFRIVMHYNFDQFIKPLLVNSVFDEYILLSHGQVVYESLPTGISYERSDSMLRNGGAGISSSGIRDQEIGGTQYKMFLQPLNLDKKNEWVLVGLLSAKRFQNERQQLSPAVVLLLVTIALAIIVAFPWLKLFHMGNQNRLTLLDGGFSLMVAMLLMSLLFFTFFRYNVPFRARDTPACKENLAEGITQAFYREVMVARDQLYHLDSLMQKNKIHTDLTAVQDSKKMNIGRMNRPYSSFKNLASVKDSIKRFCDSVSFNQVFWMDEKGIERYNWTKDNINSPHGDLSKRNYFVNAKNNHFYYLDGDTSKPFYLGQVVSWTTGTFRTQISKRSVASKDGLFVVDLSFNVKALDSMIMPAGYSFAMIDNAGNVLYHSDQTRNLNENLTEEFSNRSALTAAIGAHMQKIFVTDYYGTEYNTLIRPIPGLPYYIVILSDATFKETKDTEIYGLTISMFLLLFLYFVLEAVAVVFFSAKRSFLSRRGFITDWIWPKKSFHRIYVRASIAHCCIIALLLMFYPSSDFANLFFILPAAVTLISIFLNSLYIVKYKSEENSRFEYKVFKNYKKATTTTMIALLLVLNAVAYGILGSLQSRFFGFEGVALIVLFAFFLTFMPRENPVVQWIFKSPDQTKPEPEASSNQQNAVRQQKASKPTRNKLSYSGSYALMAITKLIISSGVPVIFLYTMDYNYEQSLLIRYRQVDFANRFMEKFHNYDSTLWLKAGTSVRRKDSVYEDENKSIDTLGKVSTLLLSVGDTTFYKAPFLKGVYNDGSWIQDVFLTDASFVRKNPVEKSPLKDSLTLSLLNLFRFYQNSIAAKESNLYVAKSSDSFIRFNPEDQNSTAHGGSTTTYASTKIPGKYLELTSHSLNYTFPHLFDNGFPFWVVFAIALIVFYLVLRYIINTMFAVNLPDVARWQQVDDHTFRENGLLFIIGPPGSGKMKEIERRMEEKWWPFDMLTRTSGEENAGKEKNGEEKSTEKKIGEKKDDQYPIRITYEKVGKDDKKELKISIDEKLLRDYEAIVINNFEYNFIDEEENCFKLRLLETLMTLEHKPHIIILSTIHPTGFLDSLHASKTNAEKDDYEPYLERWAMLLGHFRVLIWPLPRNFDLKQIEQSGIPIDENRELLSEFRYGHFVEGFRKLFKKPAVDMPGSFTEKQKLALHEFKSELVSLLVEEDPNGNSDANLHRWERAVKNCYVRMSDSNTPGQKSSLNNVAQNELTSLTINDDSGYDSDAQSYKFQLLVQNYYMHLWHSLTKEEKFLIYDLAEDGLVNSNDSYNLGMLISKGIIIRDQDRKLQLFNKSFCNFVLGSIGNIEATKIQNQITDSGHWNRLRVPLMIIIIAILGFLLTTQAETYNKIIAYLGALVTGMLTFSRFFGFFEGKETKSS